MRYFLIRDLNNAQIDIWDNLEKEGELIILDNGKPKLLLLV